MDAVQEAAIQTSNYEAEFGRRLLHQTAAPPAVNDVYNRGVNKQLSPFSRPFQFVFAGIYKVPKPSLGSCKTGLDVRRRRYQSGALIEVPSSLNSIPPNWAGARPFVQRQHLLESRQRRSQPVPRGPQLAFRSHKNARAESRRLDRRPAGNLRRHVRLLQQLPPQASAVGEE